MFTADILWSTQVIVVETRQLGAHWLSPVGSHQLDSLWSKAGRKVQRWNDVQTQILCSLKIQFKDTREKSISCRFDILTNIMDTYLLHFYLQCSEGFTSLNTRNILYWEVSENRELRKNISSLRRTGTLPDSYIRPHGQDIANRIQKFQVSFWTFKMCSICPLPSS